MNSHKEYGKRIMHRWTYRLITNYTQITNVIKIGESSKLIDTPENNKSAYLICSGPSPLCTNMEYFINSYQENSLNCYKK